jgi:hypothetical protein
LLCARYRFVPVQLIIMKFAVRALGQSLAREFHPKGVHVAHAIIDEVIAHYTVNDGKPDGKISPDAVSILPLQNIINADSSSDRRKLLGSP